MNTIRSFRSSGRVVAALITTVVAASACVGASAPPSGAATAVSGTVTIDGSSTVFPLSEAAAELFQKEQKKVRVTVGESGTGGGFKKFCAGETDISNASRPISADEKALCAKNGVTFREFIIANDGIALVVNPSNKAITCLTVPQLKKIWDTGSKVKNWNEVDAKFAKLDLKLFGAGTASGTFDFFTEAVNGKAKQSRADYNATEDDNVTVRGVSGTKGGLGYFGLSYAELNANKVKLLAVDGGKGCVVPSTKTVQDGSYSPLSRPLTMYVSAKALKRPEVLVFSEFTLANLDKLAKRTLFVPLTAKQKTAATTALAELKKLG